ncbi:Alpha/Beta hydrolase protein [Microdochium bolleyi]|uniref:Protein phosphatase methylesterase 1 n=1 Tax=Microdochium bolleyi TaxID=196109 RepID=A0A136J454_9PEZI|nr:Alpha/Beta hydrolase protein [Microdochium bolleyi]
MSDLQKAWARNRFSGVPIEPFDELDEEIADESNNHVSELPEHTFDDDSSSASSASSTGTIIPSPSQNLFARPQGVPRGNAFKPVPWTTYFERELFLRREDSDGGTTAAGRLTQHVYLNSPVDKGPLFVMHHGAGSSGLSFSVVGSEIRKRIPTAGILSIDARGHGLTTTTTPASTGQPDSSSDCSSTPHATKDASNPSQPTVDLSLSTLSSDLLASVLLTKAEMQWPELPPIILVGHSLGGAVVTELAGTGKLGNSLLGYAVLDVVEGSAMDALQSMQTYLATRPTGFASLEAGIEWHVRSRTVRNSASARASVPGLLTERRTRTGAEAGENGSLSTTAAQKGDLDNSMATIASSPAANGADDNDTRPWKWATDLAATQPFWENWFVGLSKKFLSARGGKLLLLAGTDRLDTELTIGQMQGKYALQVFPEAGHFIHEDLPEKTAIALADFHRRNDRSALVLPPKVSDLLRQGKKV